MLKILMFTLESGLADRNISSILFFVELPSNTLLCYLKMFHLVLSPLSLKQFVTKAYNNKFIISFREQVKGKTVIALGETFLNKKER